MKLSAEKDKFRNLVAWIYEKKYHATIDIDKLIGINSKLQSVVDIMKGQQ